MLIPTKYENLNQNVMVVGASVLRTLRAKKYSVEDLYQVLRKSEDVNLDRFYNVLLFLWISGLVDLDSFYVSLKSQHVS